MQPQALDQMQQVEKAPRGTWSSAFLVTDYFAVESRTKRVPVRWRAACKYGEMRQLRRRLRAADAVAAVDREAERLADRPGAGQRITGPLGLPGQRSPRPRPDRILPVRKDFQVPAESLTRPGMDWRFRSGLDRREALKPSWELWPVVGLLPPGKEA